MKPESKKDRANANESEGNKGKKKAASCYDLTKLARALDVIEDKPGEEGLNNTAHSIVKQSESSSSSFDFTKMSRELTAVEEERKRVTGSGLGCKVVRRKEDVKIKQQMMLLLAMELQNYLDLSREESPELGQKTRRTLPILVRLQRIVMLGDPRRERMRMMKSQNINGVVD